jgi:Homing endonuclease associated repeat
LKAIYDRTTSTATQPGGCFILRGSRAKKVIMTKEEIIAAIAECAAKLGHAPSIRELKAAVSMNMRELRWHFESYTNAIRAAGVKAKDPGMTPVELLFADWTRVARALGKIPTLEEYEKHGEYSGTPFQRRFQKWTNVPRGLQEYAEERGLLAGWEDVKQMVGTIRRQRRGATEKDYPGEHE